MTPAVRSELRGEARKEEVVEIRERLRCGFIQPQENKGMFASDRPAWVGLVKDAVGSARACVCRG